MKQVTVFAAGDCAECVTAIHLSPLSVIVYFPHPQAMLWLAGLLAPWYNLESNPRKI